MYKMSKKMFCLLMIVSFLSMSASSGAKSKKDDDDDNNNVTNINNPSSNANVHSTNLNANNNKNHNLNANNNKNHNLNANKLTANNNANSRSNSDSESLAISKSKSRSNSNSKSYSRSNSVSEGGNASLDNFSTQSQKQTMNTYSKGNTTSVNGKYSTEVNVAGDTSASEVIVEGDYSHYKYKESVNSAAITYAHQCGSGASAQGLGFGASVSKTNPICNLITVANEMQEAGNYKEAKKLRKLAVNYAKVDGVMGIITSILTLGIL